MIKLPEVTRNKDNSYSIHGSTGVYGNRAYVVEGADLLEVWAAYWDHMRYVGHRHCEELLREVNDHGQPSPVLPEKKV